MSRLGPAGRFKGSLSGAAPSETPEYDSRDPGADQREAEYPQPYMPRTPPQAAPSAGCVQHTGEAGVGLREFPLNLFKVPSFPIGKRHDRLHAHFAEPHIEYLVTAHGPANRFLAAPAARTGNSATKEMDLVPVTQGLRGLTGSAPDPRETALVRRRGGLPVRMRGTRSGQKFPCNPALRRSEQWDSMQHSR